MSVFFTTTRLGPFHLRFVVDPVWPFTPEALSFEGRRENAEQSEWELKWVSFGFIERWEVSASGFLSDLNGTLKRVRSAGCECAL